MLNLERTEDEVYRVLNWAQDAIDTGDSKYPGNTYEQGVYEAISWLIGDDSHAPDED